VVGSNLGAVQPVRAALVNALLGVNCNFATPILLSDIGVGVLAGGGNLNVLLGGARALTNNLSAVNPFGPGATALPPLPVSAPTAAAGLTGNSGGASALPPVSGNSGVGSAPPSAVSGASTGSTTPSTAATGGSQPVASGPVSKSTTCLSLGPSGGGCSSGNLAVPIGLVSLALASTLFAMDYQRQRRRVRPS